MKFVKLLKQVDILDLNYGNTYLNNILVKYSIKNRINDILSIFVFTLNHIKKDFVFFRKKFNYQNKHLLFFSTVNQYNGLYPLYTIIDNSIFTAPSSISNNKLPMSVGCLFSFILLPRFLHKFFKSSSQTKKLILNSLNAYFFSEGMLIWWFYYLKFVQPRSLIFSNDHSVWHRVLQKAGQFAKIPTIYIQHASVTEKFPKLEFDLSLLEGQDALDKYSKKGIDNKVALIGMLKFDEYYKLINQNMEANSIGICTNILDDEIYIEKLCQEIKSFFNSKRIILRPHPRDKRFEFYDRLKDRFKIELSDSKIENSFEYLRKVDINIAGETSIHLEAVLLNIYPIYFKFNNYLSDNYNYIKNNLISDVFYDIGDIKNLIDRINDLQNNKPNIRERAKYYVNTINSPYDGNSKELAVNNINNFIWEFNNT